MPVLKKVSRTAYGDYSAVGLIQVPPKFPVFIVFLGDAPQKRTNLYGTGDVSPRSMLYRSDVHLPSSVHCR